MLAVKCSQLHLGSPDSPSDLSDSDMTSPAHHRGPAFVIPSEVRGQFERPDDYVDCGQTMGEYEEIIVVETASGQQVRTRKVSAKDINTGIRLKLPKEYSTYAISK